MQVYLLCDYCEDSPEPEYVLATTDYEKLPSLLVLLNRADPETLETLQSVMRDIRKEQFVGPYGLTRGEGGVVLHAIELVNIHQGRSA